MEFNFFLEPTYLLQSDLCSAGNESTLSELYAAWLGLLHDSPLSDSSGKPIRTYKAFVNDLLTIPFVQLASKYDHLFDLIVESPTLYGSGSISGEYCPEFKDTPIYFEYLRFLKTGDPELLQWILSFLKFPKKFEYHDDSLHEAALRGWRASEDRLSRLSLDKTVCEHLRIIIDKFVFAYEALSFVPNHKHGPGTVANTKRGPQAKSLASYRHPSLLRLMEEEHVPQDVFPNLSVEFVPDRDDQSEWLDVPKSYKTRRSICREPAGHMYWQQAVLHNLLQACDYGPLRDFVDLQDQSLNRKAATRGSIDGRVDTIDLSSASDLVSVDLVKSIFPPRLLRHLLLTRTSKVRIRDTGEVIEVKKFAPMGSALCFPIQCLIYTAICIYASAMEQVNGDPGELDDIVSLMKSDAFFASWISRTYYPTDDFGYQGSKLARPRIFGDDIVCDYRVTPYLTEILDSCGFLVNHSKSFTGSQAIRESCGIYCYNGFDVTPVYWSPWNMGENDNQAIASYSAFTNRLYEYGYINARKVVLHLTRARCMRKFGKFGDRFLTYSNSDGDLSALTIRVSRVMPVFARNRWNVELQRFEREALRIKTKKRVACNEEFERWRLHMDYLRLREEKWRFHESDNALVSLVLSGLRIDDGVSIRQSDLLNLSRLRERGFSWDWSIGVGWQPIR